MKKTIILLTLIFSASLAHAHSFWVNTFESFAHQPGHVTVGLGWGHAMPIDDILNSPNGKVLVESFTITDPAGKTIPLKIPSAETATADTQTPNFDVFGADTGLQKIALKKESMPGVYKIEARSIPSFYTKFIDTKGRNRLKMKPKDQVKDIKKVLMAVKYQANAVSYVALKKWETPEPTNQGLEIIPMTDLSKVKAGDLVEFEVLYMGAPPKGGDTYITASTPAFDKGKHFSLYSKVKKGKAEFIVQCPGQWMVNCSHTNKIEKEGPLKDLYGKANTSITGSSLTFNAK